MTESFIQLPSDGNGKRSRTISSVVSGYDTHAGVVHVSDNVGSILNLATSERQDYKIYHAIKVIKATYGDDVSVDDKNKDLLKFGRNPNVANDSGGYTIWRTGADQAHETYVAANTNTINTISSASEADSSILTVIEGHTESGGNKTFVVQSVLTLGTSKVSILTGLNRCTRVYNNDSTNFTGPLYVYEDTAISSGKPSDTTKIHLTVAAARNQSEKASTSLSSTDYWIVTSFRGSMLSKTSAFADVALQVRLNGKVFREVEDVSCSDSHNGLFEFNPYLIIPKNADVRLVAIGDSATARDVSGSLQGYLATVL